MGVFTKKMQVPTTETALPGRTKTMPVPETHFVNSNSMTAPFPEGLQPAMFGLGCFWGAERVYWQHPGVYVTAAGYAGGLTPNPTYEEVCSGKTGHAEVIQIDYDSNIISFEKLLDVFWKSHDPTTLNRQGADTGTQYRSAVFHHNDEQQKIVKKSMNVADTSGIYENSIVTEITPLSTFYPAEDYHQDYYRLNTNAPYCRLVIQPKLKKLFDSD